MGWEEGKDHVLVPGFEHKKANAGRIEGWSLDGRRVQLDQAFEHRASGKQS